MSDDPECLAARDLKADIAQSPKFFRSSVKVHPGTACARTRRRINRLAANAVSFAYAGYAYVHHRKSALHYVCHCRRYPPEIQVTRW
jgi:hypothetical protein